MTAIERREEIMRILTARRSSNIRTLAAEMGAYLQYKFIRRALIVGALVALCAALLGVILYELFEVAEKRLTRWRHIDG